MPDLTNNQAACIVNSLSDGFPALHLLNLNSGEWRTIVLCIRV